MTRGAGRFPETALPFLRCPVCAAGLMPGERSLRCANGHNFDVAHQGYVNLLPGGARPGTADTAEMVAAREAFLAAGHYAGLRRFVCDMAERALAARRAAGGGAATSEPTGAEAGCVVEVGAGTGYYLAGVLDRLPGRVGLALDISKFAARRAARAHDRVAAVVCDAWRELPLVDGAASLVLDIFAPRNPGEIRRILRPDGALVVVTPSPRHLEELVVKLGLLKVDERKAERLEQSLGGDFVVLEQAAYEEELRLSPPEAGAVAAMGPSARHVRPEELAARLTTLGDPVEVTLSVVVTVGAPQPRLDR